MVVRSAVPQLSPVLTPQSPEGAETPQRGLPRPPLRISRWAMTFWYRSDSYSEYLQCWAQTVFRAETGNLHGYRLESGRLPAPRNAPPSKVVQPRRAR